jgi:peptide/nickel transport system substrate-binding protein
MKDSCRKAAVLAVLLAIPLLLAGCAGPAAEPQSLLNVAYNVQPASFDPMVTASISVGEIMHLVCESLFELDKDGNPRPQLCESYTKSDDNRSWTFRLRRGVKFHNGEELKAPDAAASLNRWLRKFSVARRSISGGEQFLAADDYTVTINLKNPCLLLPYMLAHHAQFAAIFPASVLQAAGDAILTPEQLIGTSSFKFAQWSVDHYVRLEKFADYKPPAAELSGFWGDRTAYIDTIMIYFIADTTTRLNGLETGEYDIAVGLAYTDADRLKAMEKVSLMYSRWNGMVVLLNKSEKSIFNRNIWRQIIGGLVNADEIMEGAIPTSGGYRAYTPTPSYFPETSPWYTDFPADTPDKAKTAALLREAGYDGKTPLRLITSKSYPEFYNAALIVKQQMEAAGVAADLLVYDWGTVLAKQGDPSVYELFPTSYPFASSPVSLQYIMKTDSSGYTNDAQLDRYVAELQAKPSFEEAITFWKTVVQPYCHEQKFVLHLGGYDFVYGVSERVSGFDPYYGLKLWGVRVSG